MNSTARALLSKRVATLRFGKKLANLGKLGAIDARQASNNEESLTWRTVCADNSAGLLREGGARRRCEEALLMQADCASGLHHAPQGI